MQTNQCLADQITWWLRSIYLLLHVTTTQYDKENASILDLLQCFYILAGVRHLHRCCLPLHFPKFYHGMVCCLWGKQTSPDFKDCFHFTKAHNLRFFECFFSLCLVSFSDFKIRRLFLYSKRNVSLVSSVPCFFVPIDYNRTRFFTK